MHMTVHKGIQLKDLEALAKQTAKGLKGGEVLALIGGLGSGKTTFTQYLAKHLSIKNPVTSPTFIIMNRYTGILNQNKFFFFHLDLYRTSSYEEVLALGITEIWGRPDTITVIEWAEKIKDNLPNNTQYFYFGLKP